MTNLEGLQELLGERGQKYEFSGVVLIQRDDEVLFAAAVGLADRTWQVKNSLDTRFRIASISKMFTAVTVLQLIEKGELAFTTGVVDCLGLASSQIPKEVTVRHLLTMTSGIADWFDESGDWEAEWAALCRRHPLYLLRRNEDYLPLFMNTPPISAVGERYHYNGAGYILLGLIIEQLSGVSYFDTIRQQIFARAGMAGADFVALDEVQPDVATGYIPVKDEQERIIGWQKNIYSTTPTAAADGGATATAVDLVRFAQALRQGKLLAKEMTQAMLTPQVSQQAEQFRGYIWQYGYGNNFILDQDKQIVRWGHTGEEDGVSARLYHYPHQNLDVVILGNQSWCAGRLGWEVHDLLVQEWSNPANPAAGIVYSKGQ